MVEKQARKGVIFRLSPEGHRLLKRQAVEADVSVQDIMEACCSSLEEDMPFRKRILSSARDLHKRGQ